MIDKLTRGTESVLFPAVLTVITIIVFSITDLDIYIQDYFYSANNGWIFDFHQKNTLAHWLYYKLPKLIVILTGCYYLVKAIAYLIEHIRHKENLTPEKRKKDLYILSVMIAIPSIVGIIKSQSNVPFPYKLARYGGIEPHITAFKAFSGEKLKSGERYKGWPGGHASAGFALMGLAFCVADKKKRLQRILLVTAFGFYMGMGHTVDGNHFFSHNLISYYIALMLSAGLYKIMKLEDKNG